MPKDDIQQFRAVCKEHGIMGEELYEFSDFLHDLKAVGNRGSAKRGDFTYSELKILIAEFRGEA